MGNDRLDWIFDEDSDASLESRYDAWASTYDDDHDAWGWRGPAEVAASALRHANPSSDEMTIIDAGCGTGRAGIALRKAGWRGRIVGLDLSRGMLDVATSTGAYDLLVRGSLETRPIRDGAADAVVSSGVFTHGHVGGAALAALCALTKPSGTVSITVRLDALDTYAPHIDDLCRAGRWNEIERGHPTSLHPTRDQSEQLVISWRVQVPERSCSDRPAGRVR